MIPLAERKGLVDSADRHFIICQQCELLSINRSTLYYTPSTAPLGDLAIMQTMDELYIEDPTRGTRRMAKALQKKGYDIGRYKVRTLMRIMRLKTIYCRPKTTVIDPAKYKYP
ncbi:MAG: IS3 family transposase [Bacteroidales bacterium]